LPNAKPAAAAPPAIKPIRINLPCPLRGAVNWPSPPTLGVAVVSTSEGLMTGNQARKKNIGGELICYVW